MKTLPREFYIAKDSQKVTSNTLPEESAVCYVTVAGNGRVNVQFFIGKQSKPSKYLAYKDLKSANDAIEAFFDNLYRVAQYKEEQKQKQKLAKQKAKDEFLGTPGSIFVASWGYEQTNVDAYQMTKRVDNQTVELVKIPLESIPHTSDGYSSMSDNVKPVPIDPKKAETLPYIRARIYSKNVIHIIGKSCGDHADLWDGKRAYYRSWYA